VKDEMNEENPIGMPKFFIVSKGVLNENEILKLIGKLNEKQARHVIG
jgi:hypothetical protein